MTHAELSSAYPNLYKALYFSWDSNPELAGFESAAYTIPPEKHVPKPKLGEHCGLEEICTLDLLIASEVLSLTKLQAHARLHT